MKKSVCPECKAEWPQHTIRKVVDPQNGAQRLEWDCPDE